MKLNNLSKFVLIVFFVFFNLFCNDETKSIRVGNWKILYKQDNSLESISRDNDWKPVNIPSNIYLPYTPVKDFQYVWLKGDFDVSGDPNNLCGLSTGRIRLADKIFINGKLIGSQSYDRVNWDPVSRNYVIPRGLLNKGKNIVYIQLGIYGHDHGGISDHVLIQDENDFNHTRFVDNLIYYLLPFGVVFLFSTLIVVFAISYCTDRKEKLHLWGSLILLTINIYVLISTPIYRFVDFELFYGIRCSILFLLSIFLILLLQSMYRISLPGFNRIVIPVLLFFVVLIHILCETAYLPSVIDSLKYLYIIILVPVFSLMLYRFISVNRASIKKTDPVIKYMVIIILILFVVIMLLEISSSNGVGHYSGLFSIFFTPVFIIFWAVLIPRQIMKRRMEMELLYDKLKRYEGRGKEVSITDSSEEKLKRVISFIDDNYTSDMSREGLAAAVDLNPGYMGGLFKSYTGKTINEYINSLRVEDARRQLQSGNTKIIDIAFSVGFENTVTFNRVFKKIEGQTPSEYKEKIIFDLKYSLK